MRTIKVTVLAPARAPALPLTPHLNVDPETFGKPPPPLGTPRSGRGRASDGDDIVLAPDQFDLGGGRHPGPEVTGGLLVDNSGVGIRRHLVRPALFPESSPQVRLVVGEIDASHFRETAVDGAE